MYSLGSSKFGDFLILFLVGFILLMDQYGIFWKAYGNMCYSHSKYLLHKERYDIVDAEVLFTDDHYVAGIKNVADCRVSYCRIRYKYGRGYIYSTLKNHPDATQGEVIKVAVEHNKLLNVERITSYSLKKYPWGWQIVLLIIEFVYVMYVFYIIDCHKYD